MKEKKFVRNLEFMTFDKVETDPKISENFPSKARPILLRKCSKGFEDPRMVALFPEICIMPKSKKNSPEAIARYLIDRFNFRFDNKTKRIIRDTLKYEKGNIFSNLLGTSNSNDDLSLNLSISSWLYSHEHFHSQDPLPRVPRGNESEKERAFAFDLTGNQDIIELAAFEELRVDLNTLEKLNDTRFMSTFGDEQGKVAWQFVFAERLLRYPVEEGHGPNEDFDSLVSHILLKYLQGKNLLSVDEQKKITFKANQTQIQTALSELLHEMNKLKDDIYEMATKGEEQFSQANLKTGRQMIIDFVRGKVGDNYDSKQNLYINHVFYENAKKLFHITDSSYPRNNFLARCIWSATAQRQPDATIETCSY